MGVGVKVEKSITFDCHWRPQNVPVITGSKDLQNVNITLRILFLVSTPASIGEDYNEQVLPSITSEMLKSLVTRLEMITQ
ncbi:hypothetical protein U0070_006531 [Myodes glareolus]|uniref:Prohibitin n=1 Tax=Myodes glareolus TaxID=447135 RepID=A0AAW0JRG2_MYOGA